MADAVPLHRNRDFSLLWIGHTVSLVGSLVTATAYPLLVLALTDSPGAAGLVGFFVWLPYLVFSVPAGWLVDRFDRRRLMIFGETGRAIAVATLVAAFALDEVTVGQIIVVAFVEGSLFVLVDLAELPAVRNVVEPEQVPAALALNQGRASGAVLAGRPLGGVLFDVGRAIPFVFDVVTYVISIVTLVFIRRPLQDEREPGGRFVSDVLAGAQWLWRQRFLRMIPILSFAINFLFQAVVLFVIVVGREAGASGTVIGVLLGLGGVGGILGAFVAPRLRRVVSLKIVIVGAIWFWALLLVVLAFAPRPYGIGFVFGLMAFASPLWNVASSTYAVAVTPDALLGRMQAFARLVALGGIPFGPLVCGLLLGAVSATSTALVLAGVMAAVALVATGSRAIRDAPPEARAV